MPDLPARNLADARLADLLEGPGCPVCAGRARAIDRYIEGWLWEGVNDVGIRRELDASRGLCPAHVGALVAADRRRPGSMLGSAILLDAMLRVRRAEIEGVRHARGARGRRRALALAARAPDCPVCRVGGEVEASAVDAIVGHVDEAAWAEATARALFCLLHLTALMRATGDAPAWRAVEEQQLGRIAVLHRTIAGFLAHSAHDTRHLRTDEEVASIAKIAALLGADTARPDERRPHEGSRDGADAG
jgi:hypothetical protein